MSEQILKALMQLFAIIARPQSNRHDRRMVVESFLKRQLNAELVKEYLSVFDKFYSENQENLEEKLKSNKKTASKSVRVLVICTELNEELTLKQKVIVLVNLLEFVKSDIPDDSEITEQEMAFISTVSAIFNIDDTDFQSLCNFALYTAKQYPTSNKIIIINNQRIPNFTETRHIFSEGIEGQVRILHISNANIFLIRYLGKSEMYLNGQPLIQDRIYVFNTGSSIRNSLIKPIYFSDVVSILNNERDNSKILFEVNNLEYKFKEGKIGLHKMNFQEESGRLVGIMGASGAGKSTLLNVLNGSIAPTSGEILINGINIHTSKKQIEGIIGFVSQDDLLIEELTVFENLYYNAKLCFDQYPNEKIIGIVSDMLQTLGLLEIKNMKVGSPLNKKISGGQRKRLNIALELIREPGILFLDEPTSGLSSRDSENIMDLLKELSFRGKLVFVVIHQPSSDIFKMFDKMLILDSGGYLIYNGDPIDSIVYFKSKMHHANWNDSECHICGNVNPEQIFNIVESRVLDEFGKLTLTRKVSPTEWNQYFIKHIENQPQKEKTKYDIPKINFKVPNYLKQFWVFTKRDVLSKLSNTQYLVINLLEAPLLGFILSYLIKYFNITSQNNYTLSSNSNLPVYIFMSVIVAIFIGLSVSAEEIIKDRKILKREAFLNLSWNSYLLSKISVLFVISAIQSLSFVLIGNSIIEIKGMYLEYWLVLFTAWASSNVLGLVISDSFKTVVTIYILIPFLVIPQIILSGVIVKYEKLNPALSTPHKVPIFGEIITARWAYEALAVYQYTENDYQKLIYNYERLKRGADFKKNYWVVDLKNKASYLQDEIDSISNPEKFKNSLLVLYNEIKKENNENKYMRFAEVEMLNIKNVNKRTLISANKYLEKLNKFYKQLRNKANESEDALIRSYQKTSREKEAFLTMKMANDNEKLTEFVTNSTEIDRIVEFKGHLYQKENPIYLFPESNLVKAHFYAPIKKIFGFPMHTLWVNVIVIWFTIILTYLILYFRLLKKLFDSFEKISDITKKDYK
jgi:ABC-type multidrug transport system ATPase subunit